MPATNSTGLTFDVDDEASFVDTDASLSLEAHEAGGKAPLGVEINWRELTNPGAGNVPTRQNDFSFESSFHSRMSPSQDPKWKNGIHEHVKTIT
jgi:hypothetical protein